MPSIGTEEQHAALKKSKMMAVEEQCDSGLGSMGLISQDGYLPSLNLSSLPEVTEETHEMEDMDEVENALHNLKIDSRCTRAEDSGVYNSIPYNSLRECERVRLDAGYDKCSDNECNEDEVDGSTHTEKETCARSRKLCPTAEQMVKLYEGDKDGDNHLNLSIIHGNIPLSLFLIDCVPEYDWLSFCNLLRQTPLHLAVLTRQAQIVRRLICAGASVTAQDKQGDTPLHIACRMGYEEIVRHLLTPVTYSETLRNREPIPFQRVPQDLSIKNGDGESCLHVAARSGHIDIVQILLAAGANVNARDAKSGRTVLHLAAEADDVELVEVLLDRSDIIVNSSNYEGRTPVQLAYGRNYANIVDILCRYARTTADDMRLSDFSDFEISDDEDMSDDTETSGYDSTMSSGH